MVISRRGRLLIGGIAALVMATVLVAPVVLLTGSGAMHAKRCAQPLRYQSREYLPRPVAPMRVVEGVAIGIGAASGCGASASNINTRSLLGVKPTAAVGLVHPAGSSAASRRRLAARGRVLGRPDSWTIGAPCVLATNAEPLAG